MLRLEETFYKDFKKPGLGYSVFKKIQLQSTLCVSQGVVTLIGPVEPFATGIKMKSSDQEAI